MAGRIREGLLEFQGDAWSVRLGRQIIAWGRADRINPTDYLSPRDFTLLVPEDDEQRNGIGAALVQWSLDDAYSITGIISLFEPHQTPEGSLPPNLATSEKPGRAEKALKLDHAGSGVDWSVSYFEGYNRFLRYEVDSSSPTTLIFKRSHEAARALGVDFATSLGTWTMRGEAAYMELQPDCPGCEHYRRHTVSGVLGADRYFWDTANFNLQAFVITRSGYHDPSDEPAPRRALLLALNRLNSEFGESEWGMTTRVSGGFLNDRLKLELSAIADFTNHSMALRPRGSYSLSDAVKLSVGADHFSGPEHSYFGAREDNSVSFVELVLIF